MGDLVRLCIRPPKRTRLGAIRGEKSCHPLFLPTYRAFQTDYPVESDLHQSITHFFREIMVQSLAESLSGFSCTRNFGARSLLQLLPCALPDPRCHRSGHLSTTKQHTQLQPVAKLASSQRSREVLNVRSSYHDPAVFNYVLKLIRIFSACEDRRVPDG